MKSNVGTLDRITRIFVGFAIFGICHYYHSWWGLVGILPVLTGIVRFCPAYVPFGLSTCGVKAEKPTPGSP